MEWIPQLERVLLAFGIVPGQGFWLREKYRFTGTWLFDQIVDYEFYSFPAEEALDNAVSIFPAQIAQGAVYEREDTGLDFVVPETAYIHRYSLSQGYALDSGNCLIINHVARYAYTDQPDNLDDLYEGTYPVPTMDYGGSDMLPIGGFPDSWEYDPPASCYDVGSSTYPYSAYVQFPFCQYLAPESAVARGLIEVSPDGLSMGVFDSQMPDYFAAEGEEPAVTWLNNLQAAGYSGQVILQGGTKIWRACGMSAIPLNQGFPAPETGLKIPGYDPRMYSPVSGVGTILALSILGRKNVRPLSGLFPWLKFGGGESDTLTIDGDPLTIDGDPLEWS